MHAAKQEPHTPTPMSEVTDAALLAAAQVYLERQLAGDASEGAPAEAWQRFYELYGPLIRRFTLACQVPKSEVDDCVQDVFRTVIVALRDFKYDPDQGRFRSWLFSVVRSRATDLVRRRLRRAARRFAPRADATTWDAAVDPVETLERRWRQEVVHTVVKQLREQVSPRNFEVFYLRSIKELSVAETATKLGSTPEKVRYRHHRMVRKFRELYFLYTGETLDAK